MATISFSRDFVFDKKQGSALADIFKSKKKYVKIQENKNKVSEKDFIQLMEKIERQENKRNC